jgi:hypothetical protein
LPVLENFERIYYYSRLQQNYERYKKHEFYAPCLVPEKQHRGVNSRRTPERGYGKQRILAYPSAAGYRGALVVRAYRKTRGRHYQYIQSYKNRHTVSLKEQYLILYAYFALRKPLYMGSKRFVV